MIDLDYLTAARLTPDEMAIISKVENHNKSKKMSIREKLRHAKLVALYDLELGHFTQEQQRLELSDFARKLETILRKI
jgi:hypothetical protein